MSITFPYSGCGKQFKASAEHPVDRADCPADFRADNPAAVRLAVCHAVGRAVCPDVDS